MSLKTTWFLRGALALLVVQLTACPEQPQPPPPPEDTSPPSTRANPLGGSFTSAQTVTLACDDGSGSGCDATYYTTDGSNPTTGSTRYGNPISLRSTTTLKFFSVDKAGNQESVRAETYTINLPPADTEAPTTTASPAGGTYTSVQTVTLTCNDGSGSGCANTYYTTDGSDPTTRSNRYTAPLSISATTTLKFFSVDQAGNQEQARTETYTLNIPPADTQAPTTTASPAGGSYNAAQSVTLTCNDGSGSGCANTYYTTDGSNPTTSSTPYAAPIPLFVSTTLKFFSVDAAGNAESVRTEAYVIDTSAPTTTAAPAGGTYGTAQSVTLTCADSTGVGCANTYYTTDGTEPTTSSTPYTAPIAIAANTTLKFFSVDRVGNAEAVRTQTYVIDTQPPTTTASPVGGTYSAAQSVTLTCNDGSGSGCAATYYTTDGSTPTTSSPRYSSPLSIDGNATLKFFSVDSLGNAEPVRTETYVITAPDTRAPTTTASPAGGSYNTAQSVTLTCNDSVGGSGCANTYYTTDGSEPTTGSTRYTAPIAIAANTTLKFFSVDSAGNQEQVRTASYVIDSQAPTTTASPAGGAYNTAQSVTLTCGDGSGSGCANTYYTTDGSNPTTGSTRYTAPIAIAASTTLKFFSVDSVGNQEQVRTASYVIDSQAPTTAASPAGGNYSVIQTVTLTCNDGSGSGCAATYYTVDGSTPTTSSPRYSAPIDIEGTVTLKFFSVDSAGNAEAVRTESYVITAPDTRAPTTTASPAGGTYNTTQSITLSCGDGAGGSGCSNTYYTTDGSDPTTGSLPYTSPIPLFVTTTLKFFSVDRAGNQEPIRSQLYIIDTTAPTTTATPAGGNYNAAQTVTLACNDGTGTGCTATYYTTDGSNPTTGSTRYTAPLAIATSTTLKFFSVDSAGNAEAARTESYVIDTVAPTTTATPAGGTFNTSLSITLTCNDGSGTGCGNTYYTTDGSNPTTGSQVYTGPLPLFVTTTLKFFSVDNAGNQEPIRTQSYIIDTAAPTTTAAPASGTYNSAQAVTLTCGDGSGTGCTATYYTTNGSNPTTGSPRYTAPIAIAANTTLKFFSVDGAGNAEAIRTETYVIDTVAPTTTATPAGGTYNSARAVTLTCGDGTGSGCATTYYTTDGSNPTSGSPRYTAPIAIAANTTLKFFSVDNAGNQEAIRTANYIIDTQAPVTTPSPAGGTYTSAQTVTLTCNDGTGSGCAATYYTTNGSDPTTGSPRYTGPIAIAADTTLKFFSVDNAGNAETIDIESYTIITPTSASAQIAAVRAAANGAINLPVNGAFVTYLKPAVGNDPAGFFLQAEQAGPAIFVAIAPNTLAPVPAVGDRVLLRATQKATVDSQARITAVGSYARFSQGTSIEPLRADVSTVDFSQATALTDRESELITITGRASTVFTGAGAGHVQSTLTTTGTPTGTNLRLRLPTTLQDQLDLAQNCNVTIRAPLWRFGTTAQPSAWVAGDVSSISCPGPRVALALPTDPTTLVVRFDRRIDPASVLANGSQFTFTNGLVATGAVVVDREVILTTSAQVSGAPYQVTVANTVRDTYGNPVGATGNTATFTGYRTPATLLINEVAPNVANSRDLVELLAVQGGSVNAFTLTQEDNPSLTLATLPDVVVATGDIIVIHLNPASTNGDAPASETTGKAQYPAATYSANYDSAWDFQGSGTNAISYTHRVLRLNDLLGNTQDGVAFARPGLTGPPTSFPGTLQALQADSHWSPPDCGGALCTYTSTPTAVEVSANWNGVSTSRATTVFRTSLTDTNAAGDWTVGASTLGASTLGASTLGASNIPDTTAPTTTASPIGGTYASAQSVTLSCNDSTGSGCAATYYTTDGSNPTTGSPRYTTPLNIATTTTLKFFSVDNVGNAEAIRTEVYTLDISPSSQIAAMRTAANGAINLPVNGALVTYVKPLIGTDPAGFFLQADRAGPAIFVAVDPATLTPTPTVGDAVSLTATTKATQDGQARITALTGYTRLSQGGAVEGLRVDASNADFSQVTETSNYESRLIYISGTLATGFSAAGTGFEQATLATLGTPTGTNLSLRVNSILRDQFDLANGCSLDVFSPMWRFNNTAQPSIWVPTDLGAVLCPAPRVTGALATTSTTVTVRFDRRIDPASVLTDGSQFTLTGGLVATAATVVDREVRLTTNAQTTGTTYQVTVDRSVSDTYGTPVDATANTASFIGFNSVRRIAARGARLTITGSGFTGATAVTMGGVSQAFTVGSDTSITLSAVNDNTPVGDQLIVVTTPSGPVTVGLATVMNLVINELDSDTPGTDTLEFVEIATGVANLNLTGAGYSLVFFNGGVTNDPSYFAVDLTGTTNSNGLLVLGSSTLVPGPQMVFLNPSDNLQNGQDAVAIYQALASTFPLNTPVTATNLIDAIVYDTSDPDDPGLLDTLIGPAGSPQRVQVDENANSNSANQSIQRCSTGRRDGRVFSGLAAPTPGAVNTCP